MHKPKERDGAASPAPVFMSPGQMTNYLQDLRTNRPARPTGSRPPPAHFNTWSSRASAKFVSSPAVSPFSHPTFKDAGVDVDAPPQPTTTDTPSSESKTHRRTTSNMSIDEILAGGAGRPLVQPPRGRNMSTASTARERTPSVTYRENAQRQAEREEAMAVRIAMEELELKEEQKLYAAARDEAAELVWKHCNPNAPGNNPDAPYPYPARSEAEGHQRSRSLGRGEQDLQRSQSKLRKRNSMGSSAGGSRSSSLQGRRTASGSSVTANAGFARSPSPTKENFEHGAGSYFPPAPQRKSSNPSDPKAQRRSSSAQRKASGSLFKNPDDKIYEEPEEETPPPAVVNPPPPAKLPLGVRRNPFSRLQSIKDNKLVRSQTDPIMGTKRFDRYEIHKNPLTNNIARDTAYTKNAAEPKPKEKAATDAENEPEAKMKDGKEVRSDDIRAATRFRLKDRSAKLPTPTLVSDSPGRPIVSFRNDWKPKEVELKEEISAFPESAPKPVAQEDPRPRPLSKAATAPTVVPTIHVQDEPPKRTVAPSPTPPQYKTNAMPPVAAAHKMPAPISHAPSTRVSRAQVPAINVYEDPPARPHPNTTRKVNTPTQSAAPPVPTINIYQAPPARSKPSPAPPIPTISVQEMPSISVSAPSGGRPSMREAVSAPSVPSISINEPSAPARGPRINAPSISVTPSVPSINVNGPPSISASPSVPSIAVNGPPSSTSTRPLPNPRNHTSPFPRTNNAASRSHWTPTTASRAGVLCAQCALPIAGRIVSAAGHRFHPDCFQCNHCGEHLECVAFYPEPDNKHAQRVARIQARQRGEDIQFLPTHPTADDMHRLEQEDGFDQSLRFYCHLDFHELFSPRCKSCKTPIEGEVVVACGAEWHVGHFFCAQCGDPFDSTTPFVEKEGYAWCVGCHTNRFSTKCRKCRKPVTDTVVKALGSEWHVGCFCCVECSGPFEDGRYFLRGDSEDPVCVRCEERRLKA